MIADDLAVQGAAASSAMVLTKLVRNIPVSRVSSEYIYIYIIKIEILITNVRRSR